MKKTLKNFASCLFWVGLLGFMFSCKGMYDNIEPYSEVIIYPAKYDTIVSKIGFERVELDLMKAGRIPSKQISMGKSVKTIVEYDDKQIIIDSLVSWVSVPELTQPKLYRIKVYTVDQYDNPSVAQEIAVIPFTTVDIDNITIQSPRVLSSPNAAVIDWTNSLSSVLMEYKSVSYEYEDKNGEQITGIQGNNPRIFAANLQSGEPLEVTLKYHVIPKIGGVSILDSVEIVEPLNINIPTGSSTFNPAEGEILATNGINIFTSDGVSSFTKLIFPIHTNTLQDLFYFPNIQELDLTGGDLFDLTSLKYDRNGVVKTIGGGNYQPFIRKVAPISDANAQTMVDLLKLGNITKVKYIRNSMGIDHLLEPFDEEGLIEWVEAPDEALIPMNFFIDGKVQSNAWALDIVNPSTDHPAGMGIENPFKVTMVEKNGSFVFTLPKEYRFNIAEYKYLKFKVYAPAKSTFAGDYAPFQRLWPRFMNYLWAFTNESTFGQELWNPDANNYKINDADLQKWTDITVDLSSQIDRHNRVVVINIGGEPSMSFNPTTDMTYYFSNFRFSKN